MLVPKLGRPVLAGASISAMMIFASGNRPRYLERVVVGVGDGGVNSDKQRFVRGDEAARLPRARGLLDCRSTGTTRYKLLVERGGGSLDLTSEIAGCPFSVDFLPRDL